MPIEMKLELSFERAHVQDPLICDMARRQPDLMFNIDTLSVGSQEALMRIALIADPPELRKSLAYFESLGVTVKVLSEEKFKGTIPQLPPRSARPGASDQHVERKLWLTFLGSLRRNAFLWVLARRYDVTFKITQSTTGDPVSIVSLLLWGPAAEVDGAVAYLRQQGVNVEYGELPLSTPFGPSS